MRCFYHVGSHPLILSTEVFPCDFSQKTRVYFFHANFLKSSMDFNPTLALASVRHHRLTRTANIAVACDGQTAGFIPQPGG